MAIELLEQKPTTEVLAGDMAWTKPLNTRGRIDLAGDVISGRKPPTLDMDIDTAFDVAGNWRSSSLNVSIPRK
jgi:hypothetical protein